MEAKRYRDALKKTWSEFSLMEQLGNIGSEVGRTRNWQGKDEKYFQGAFERALELFDLTLEDPRWENRGALREIALARELFCSAALGEPQYDTSLEYLDNYFLQFALTARRDA